MSYLPFYRTFFLNYSVKNIKLKAFWTIYFQLEIGLFADRAMSSIHFLPVFGTGYQLDPICFHFLYDKIFIFIMFWSHYFFTVSYSTNYLYSFPKSPHGYFGPLLIDHKTVDKLADHLDVEIFRYSA